MTTPFWCLLVVAFLPYLLALGGLYFRIKQFGHWDNDNPRGQYSKLEGAGWRVWASQQNAWEALGLFTATVAVAHLAGADAEKSAIAAIIFLVGLVKFITLVRDNPLPPEDLPILEPDNG